MVYNKFGLAILCFILLSDVAEACTRFVYKGHDGIVVSARSQDWKEDIQSKFWKFPRGMKRNGGDQENSINWISKYGSVVISGYDNGTAEGVNEKGLAVHMLWLADSEYRSPSESETILFTAWVQYVLDMHDTTESAVGDLKKRQLKIIPFVLPTGHQPKVHIAITDSNGDSAIVEYIEGKQVIYHSPKYTVMTNEPPFDKQLAIQKNRENNVNYDHLPGSISGVDRFTRVKFYLKNTKKTADAQEALATARSILETVTVPRGLIGKPAAPNLSTTVYRSLFDHKNMTYYYQGTSMPSFFWINLNKFVFSKGSDVLMLDTEGGKRALVGDVSNKFVQSEPFDYRPMKHGN